ncbi:MAG: UDP-N-acetylglucosamine--N-acetylmuramyl-(pentapeptide) pyrophosphoryl-undecaprenol N-acetylglucosamine transferase [Methanobacterium sp.]|uniref:UDP-N-acetylglucosamine--N-acetylmuramyl- (pentapeptide) pyrophosphoryl-undecaprenol N-acetylglucosamine transferase n=1 Tax=Methanobacterium sp. TaxID=2164 RepID=UPI003D652953|nr:UDP-N-acetylglucosamine--N-acetylmuramyl-(pentapeptide) pyrophosphoryl-undecaprenol N-acetylglucosamine transferase [Methanobacterium sp.]
MKVLMMPCGIGMGHISRDIAIAQKLQERNIEIVFASYGSGYDMLKEYGKYETVKLPEIKFYGDGGELNMKYTAKKSIDTPFIFLKSIYHESKIIKKYKPDVVVADSHYSIPITCKVLGVPCILITNELTLNFSDFYPDEKPMEYLENGLKRFIIDVSNQCNAILIPDIKNSIEIPPKLKNKTTFIGPILKNSSKNLLSKKELRKKHGFNNSEKIVLVTVGGSDFGKNLLQLVCKTADKIEASKIIMITGPKIESDFIPDSNKIIKKKFQKDIMEWMKLSDIVISLAGHNTTMELACLGIPSILIPIANHPEQLKNALNMEKYGISKVMKLNKINSKDFANEINRMLTDDNLKMKTNKIKKEFDKYDGTEIAAEIISKHAALKEQHL